jgi:peptide/nickel transport system substrate-binding protein
MWMAFLTGYVLPKAYYEKVGAEGFEKKPIGSGPYMVDEYQGNAFLRLKANPGIVNLSQRRPEERRFFLRGEVRQ